MEDKRQLYACGTKFTTLDQVAAWSQHGNVGKIELPSGMLLFLNNNKISAILRGGMVSSSKVGCYN